MKQRTFASLASIILILALSTLFAGSPTVSAQEKFTEADAKELMSTDPDAVSEVLYKLVDMFDESGKEALKPAVPHLVKSLYRELSIPEDERWNLVDLVKVISLSGDERITPVLLNIMSVMWGGGNPFVAQGFLSIGPSTISAVADSINSKNPETRGRAALTLHKMNELDGSGTFFSPQNKEKIKNLLKPNLSDSETNVRVYTVVAMRSFGDKEILPSLEFIEKNDAHKDSGGTYEVRLEASETLKILRDKLK